MFYRKNLWSDHRSSNLRLILAPSLSPEVKRSCKKFHKWARKEFVYPVRLTIYVLDRYRIRGHSEDSCFSEIHFPEKDPSIKYPYIGVAGKCRFGKDLSENDNELGSVLIHIMTHISHYLQWVDNGCVYVEDSDENERLIDEFTEEWIDWYAYKHERLYPRK